jgi:hypothetical protein
MQGMEGMEGMEGMRKCGLGVVQQRGIVVFYDGVIVGEFTTDLLVEARSSSNSKWSAR